MSFDCIEWPLMADPRAHGGLEADEVHMGGRTQCRRRGAPERQGIGLRGAQRALGCVVRGRAARVRGGARERGATRRMRVRRRRRRLCALRQAQGMAWRQPTWCTNVASSQTVRTGDREIRTTSTVVRRRDALTPGRTVPLLDSLNANRTAVLELDTHAAVASRER